MTKMTQKNYEGIKIYRQKMKIFGLKGLVQRLGNNVEDLTLQKDLLIVENNKLRGLMKGCKHSIFKIYDRLRFSDENEITPTDLINAVDEIKPMLWGILNSINAALGESEEK